MAQQPEIRPPAQVKRFILCFDGTWNTPEDQTNVSRMYAEIADQHAGCDDQLKFYDAGVGTSEGSKLTGGALGWGIDYSILQGYCWLINEYIGYSDATPPAAEADGQCFAAGPDIFIFGFSRGAFAARSLAGLINRCGVLKRKLFEGPVNPITKKKVDRATPDSPLVRDAWKLYQRHFDDGVDSRLQEPCVKLREASAIPVKIKFLGVWDTVGALGVPMFSKTWLARTKYGFHDMSLGRVIENAYHAVAIDEQREDYQVALWDATHPCGTQVVEQRWFPGAHANVGGGYQDDLLPDPPLRWMAEKALRHGLEFTDQSQLQLGKLTCKAALPSEFSLRGDEYLSPVRDSYAEFLHGVYRGLRTVATKGRYYRPMLTQGINETIDETAHLKWSAQPTYRPPNFANAGRSDFTPGPLPGIALTAGQARAGRT